MSTSSQTSHSHFYFRITIFPFLSKTCFPPSSCQLHEDRYSLGHVTACTPMPWTNPPIYHNLHTQLMNERGESVNKPDFTPLSPSFLQSSTNIPRIPASSVKILTPGSIFTFAPISAITLGEFKLQYHSIHCYHTKNPFIVRQVPCNHQIQWRVFSPLLTWFLSRISFCWPLLFLYF